MVNSRIWRYVIVAVRPLNRRSHVGRADGFKLMGKIVLRIKQILDSNLSISWDYMLPPCGEVRIYIYMNVRERDGGIGMKMQGTGRGRARNIGRLFILQFEGTCHFHLLSIKCFEWFILRLSLHLISCRHELKTFSHCTLNIYIKV